MQDDGDLHPYWYNAKGYLYQNNNINHNMVYVNGQTNLEDGNISQFAGAEDKIVVGVRCKENGDANEWTDNNPSNQLFINQLHNTPGSGDTHSILYDVVVYSDRKTDDEMVYIMEHFDNKHSIYSHSAPSTLIEENIIFKYDGRLETNYEITSSQEFNYNNISISKNLNTNVTHSHSLTTVDDVNIVTSGGLNIDTHSDRSLDFMGNTCIKHIKSMVPNIITTRLLQDSTCITSDGDENTGQFILDPLKTINIVSISNDDNIISTYNTSDIFMRIKLQPGKYNGQICKIVLHPAFENTLNIEERTNNGYLQEVILRTDKFISIGINE
jgi:hypothetical protein